MDWSNVTAKELLDALREVELKGPRPIWEFMTKFSVPKNQNKWTSRLKCNVYYYRINYLFLFALASAGCFFRQPYALASGVVGLLALLCFNDPFCAALNEAAIKVIRKVHPHTASVLRSQVASSMSGNLGSTVRKTKSNVKVLGLQRPLFVGLLGVLSLFLMYRGTSYLSLFWALLFGLGLPLVHATFRSPNLKARLASAREEFRAVWRGYQADMSTQQHDYTL